MKHVRVVPALKAWRLPSPHGWFLQARGQNALAANDLSGGCLRRALFGGKWPPADKERGRALRFSFLR
jgi:hypothetical protein